MKKYISFALAAVMLLSCFSLTSCDRDKDKDHQTYVEDGATKIIVYAREFENWSKDHLSNLANSFNSNLSDGIQVEVKYFGSDTYSDALTVARENGKTPDLYMSTYADLFAQINQHHAAPLDSYLSSEAKEDILPAVRKMVTYDGSIYAYPWNLEPATLFYYRKDMLSDAGVTSVPTTWDELYAACSKIKQNLNLGQYCLGLPLGSGELGWVTYGMQYNTTGGLALDESWKQSLIDTNDYKDVAEFFYNIYVNDYAPSAALTNEGYTYIVDALCDGKLAMTFAGSWCIAEIYDYDESMVDNIGVAVIPTRDGNTDIATSSNGGWSYCISEESKNKDKAATFLNWMFTQDAARTAEYFILAHNSKAPTSQSVKNYLAGAECQVPSEWVAVVNDVASKAIPEATYPWDIALEVGKIYETMQVNCKKGSFEALYGTALNTANNNISSIMSRSSYPENPNYKQQ